MKAQAKKLGGKLLTEEEEARRDGPLLAEMVHIILDYHANML